MQKPTMGRVVRYVDKRGNEYAAMIAYVVDDTTVNLTVYDHDGSTEGEEEVPYSEGKARGCWHWPEIERPAFANSTSTPQ
jgi:hypothetical protein